jgi:hypothetical protein
MKLSIPLFICLSFYSQVNSQTTTTGVLSPGIFASPQTAGFIIDHTCIDVSDNIIPQTYLNSARSLDILFNHQSVGYNIIEGLQSLADLNPTRYSYVNENWPSADWYDTSDGLGDFTAGDNGDPQSKVNGFDALLRTDGYGAHVDVAYMKFCFVDNTTSASQIWNWYRTAMLNLETTFPSVQFVWWTMPIMTDGDAIRDQFNTLVRTFCSANNKILFDIADIECHNPSGALVTNNGYQAMYAGYTDDGGHLKEAGRLRVARATWWLWARCAGWSSSNPMLLRLRAFLEGPYNPALNQMTTLLKSNGLLPLTSPFTEDPVHVTAIPDSITDWILVQLRQSTNGAAVASQSCLLSRNGYVISASGQRSLSFQVAAKSYYIVLRHRNHVSIMSAVAVALNSSLATFYNFTDSAARTYGANGSKQIAGGIWGLWCGDVDQDKVITTRDYVRWFNDKRNGLGGYQATDINCDALISLTDYTMWQQNAAAGIAATLP